MPRHEQLTHGLSSYRAMTADSDLPCPVASMDPFVRCGRRHRRALSVALICQQEYHRRTETKPYKTVLLLLASCTGEHMLSQQTEGRGSIISGFEVFDALNKTRQRHTVIEDDW